MSQEKGGLAWAARAFHRWMGALGLPGWLAWGTPGRGENQALGHNNIMLCGYDEEEIEALIENTYLHITFYKTSKCNVVLCYASYSQELVVSFVLF